MVDLWFIKVDITLLILGGRNYGEEGIREN